MLGQLEPIETSTILLHSFNIKAKRDFHNRSLARVRLDLREIHVEKTLRVWDKWIRPYFPTEDLSLAKTSEYLKTFRELSEQEVEENKGKSKVTDMAEANLTGNDLLNTGKME